MIGKKQPAERNTTIKISLPRKRGLWLKKLEMQHKYPHKGLRITDEGVLDMVLHNGDKVEELTQAQFEQRVKALELGKQLEVPAQ